MTNLTIASQGGILPLNQPVNDIIEALIASKHKASTRYTYVQNLKYFAHYLINGLIGKGKRILMLDVDIKRVLGEFLAMDKVTAICYLSQYQNELIEADYVPNTINIRLSAIRSLVKFAFKRGFCNWLVEDLLSLGTEVYRDTSGVSKDIFSDIISGILTDTISGKRDYAILRLLWDNALRRSEVSNLNIEDFDSKEGTLKIKGKGKFSKEVIYLSPKTCEALTQWLGVRYNPLPNQPLFISLATNTNGHRLTGKSIYCIVRKYADPVLTDKILSPHRVRHSSITALLDASGGNVRLAQKLSRHKNLDVLTRYDDNRVSLQKEAVNILASLV
ncbi:tyrosine-type recombinase/integrase [Geminocystis sp. CENA526]|uniref:tyrosine-type recombinase/integrase n=1 Tax=Geminocystis sp. CENA526 TaxID=1355871 RepID=UPI003D6EF321